MSVADEVKEALICCGWSVQDAHSAIQQIKREAVEADNAYENEVGNLRNAVNEATGELQRVLYNLRNA